MNLEEVKSKYTFCDGQMVSCVVNFTAQSSAIIILKVREQIAKEIVDVKLELAFENLVELNVYENFESEYYSDITLLELENGIFYLSLDPFDNSNKPNENDNFVVKAKSLKIKQL